MKPVSLHITYRPVHPDRSSGSSRVVDLPFGPVATPVFSLGCEMDATGFSVRLEAHAPLAVQSCKVVLEHAFDRSEMVLLNGYQSWTDTSERPAFSIMRGLIGSPRLSVANWSLDASGDYRFADYSLEPGTRHGWTYATFELDGVFTLLGSLDERSGFTLVATEARRNRVIVSHEPPARIIDAGETVQLCSCAIERGTQREVYDRWLARYGVTARTTVPLCGYTSWYRHYGDIDETKLLDDLAGAADAFAGFDTTGSSKVFQVDDGWCPVGDWDAPRTDRFPNGPAAIARAARDAGFIPGLWMSPFVCERKSRTFAEHRDWLLTDEHGRPVSTGSHWSRHFALDTRNPQVRDAVREWVGTAMRDWGFGLLKLDFLYAACMLPHDGMNRGELMADAVELLREAAGEDCLLLGCGVPLASTFGIFDYCRVGCDVGLDWNDRPHMRLLHRERVSSRNSVHSTIGRSPLDGRTFGCDPDVVFLRDDARLTAEQRGILLYAAKELGSVLLTSDDMGRWDEGQRTAYQQALDDMISRRAR